MQSVVAEPLLGGKKLFAFLAFELESDLHRLAIDNLPLDFFLIVFGINVQK